MERKLKDKVVMTYNELYETLRKKQEEYNKKSILRKCVGKVSKTFHETSCSMRSAFGYYEDADGYYYFYSTSEKGGYPVAVFGPYEEKIAIKKVLTQIESELANKNK